MLRYERRASAAVESSVEGRREPAAPTGDGSHAKDPFALELIRSLCRALKAEGIDSCIWKSSATIDRAVIGQEDLDLLVRRADVQRFSVLLQRLGFKEARGPEAQQPPGVLHYYGHDAQTHALVHVHAHYQLVMGQDGTKNYRLPIERALLQAATEQGHFRIASPEFELILFVIRQTLKHSTLVAVASRESRLPDADRAELQYLQARASQQRVHEVLKQHLPFLERSSFAQCLDSLQPGRSLRVRLVAGRRLRTALKAHARRGAAADASLMLWRRLARGVRRRLPGRSRRMRLTRGGALIAIVGGDGAGKSTMINGLSQWLSQDFDTTTIHLGKPPRSWVTVVVRGILACGRMLRRCRIGNRKEPDPRDGKVSALRGYAAFFQDICTAHDRYRAYARARRAATNGRFVICDRFPLPQIRLMDCVRNERAPGPAPTNRILRFLLRFEQRCYRHIMHPDLLFVLRVRPEVAVGRKSEEAAAFVRTRCDEVWRADWSHTAAIVIDAGRTGAEVLSELKSHVWSEL